MVKFSAIMPVYNAHSTIQRTVDSVRNQTFSDWELIVVDGGSSDGTLDIIRKIDDPRVKIHDDSGGSITTAVNKGIVSSKGDIVMPWLCADDFINASFFESTLDVFLNQSVDLTYCEWNAIVDDKVIKWREPEQGWEKKLSFGMPRIMSNTFVFRKKVFDQLGLLEEDISYANDYEFIRRCIKANLLAKRVYNIAYYYSVGGLSQSKLLSCLLEVAGIAMSYGDSKFITYSVLVFKLIMVKISFILNYLRARMPKNFIARCNDDSIRF